MKKSLLNFSFYILLSIALFYTYKINATNNTHKASISSFTETNMLFYINKNMNEYVKVLKDDLSNNLYLKTRNGLSLWVDYTGNPIKLNNKFNYSNKNMYSRFIIYNKKISINNKHISGIIKDTDTGILYLNNSDMGLSIWIDSNGKPIKEEELVKLTSSS